MLLRLKSLVCLHKPVTTIQEVIHEYGFGPNCAEVTYHTRCAKCGEPLAVRWLRPNVTLLEPPVLNYIPRYLVSARLLPTFGKMCLPFNSYSEVVEGNH